MYAWNCGRCDMDTRRTRGNCGGAFDHAVQGGETVDGVTTVELVDVLGRSAATSLHGVRARSCPLAARFGPEWSGLVSMYRAATRLHCPPPAHAVSLLDALGSALDEVDAALAREADAAERARA